jgi:cell division septum initiation protein DivIVA
LLDTLALAKLTRMAFEEIGEKEAVNGPAFEPWLEVSRSLEAHAWDDLAVGVFSAEQLQELRDVLQRWWDTNPAGHLSFVARPAETRSLIRQTAETTSRPGSVFSLVGLDPTAGLDPAVREVTRTRLTAERALFMAQRMPFLVRWHLELLADDLLAEQRIAELLTTTARLTDSTERISRSVESISTVAAELPDRITAERQAILEAIKAQEGTLRELAGAISKTLVAGESMSTSINTTLTTFDALMDRFGVGEPDVAGQSGTPKVEPFRILDYAQTATQLEGASRQLTVLLQTLDQTLDSTNLTELSTQVGLAVEQARTGSREVVDHAFWRALLLVAAVLAAALLYRWISGRLARSEVSDQQSKNGSQ